MKSYSNRKPVVFAAGLSLLFTSLSHPQGQNKPSLEQRVETLEQKVKMLENQILFFTMTGGKGGVAQRTYMMMQRDMVNIGSQAWQYFKRPGNLNGGGGSYVGFTLAPKMARTDYGTYSVFPRDTEIDIEGHATLVVGMIRATAGVDGKLRNWTSTGDLDGLTTTGFSGGNEPLTNTDSFRNEINNIAAHAYQYRIRPRGSGGSGSYSGYVLPKEMSSTATGWYAVMASDTAIAIEGRHKRNNTIFVVFVDSVGKTPRTIGSLAGDMKKPVGGSRTAFDSLRETITKDFVSIAARAYQYKILPSESGGGGGKYTGYLSAQTASINGGARYDFFVDPDAVLLKASLSPGTGSMSVKVDNNGRLSGWYYSGDLAR
jgi:hypothetical protein